MDSNVVEFPGAELPSKNNSELARKEIHAQAFCDLEGDVCDLERMGQIAQDRIVQCVGIDRELELSSFAVMQLAKMLREFKDRYYKRYGQPAAKMKRRRRSAGKRP